MKICLINPPSRNGGFNNFKYDPYNQPVQSPGLAYIAAMLEEHGFPVDVLECYAASISLESLYKKIKDEQYDMIGISAFYWKQDKRNLAIRICFCWRILCNTQYRRFI